ncbi:MAG: cbb3-type cytochrome c oxidase subunit 3 [Pseudomonadota bacterium]
MQESSLLRELADNWMLLAMFTLFIGAVLWPFRPGSRKDHDEAANIPFAHDDKPADDPVSDAHGKEAQV